MARINLYVLVLNRPGLEPNDLPKREMDALFIRPSRLKVVSDRGMVGGRDGLGDSSVG